LTPVYSLVAIALAYAIGSLSFAVIVSRMMGLGDPRAWGSGNPGATNVLRSGSKSAAILTLLLDAAKGWLPLALLHWFGARWGLGQGTLALAALAAFAGHLWPVFFGFQGGKGVATALGVLLGIEPWLALAVALIWLLAAAVWRYSSLAALIAAVCAPVLYLLCSGLLWYAEAPLATSIAALTALLFLRHRANIARLLAGQEGKIGQKSAATAPGAPRKRPHAGKEKKSAK